MCRYPPMLANREICQSPVRELPHLYARKPTGLAGKKQQTHNALPE